MAINSPFYERVYVQTTSALRAINNSSGTWTNSGSQAIRVMAGSINMQPNENYTPAQWVHGTRSQVPKLHTRKSASWTLNIPLVPSGTAGTAPDMDIILQSIFGGAGTVVTSTSVTYNIFDQANILFNLFQFSHSQSATGNRYALGCIPQRASFTFNSDLMMIQVSGLAVTTVQNEEFSNVDTVAKGGLTTFPAEPGGFSLSGSIIPGFGGTLVLDGNTISNQCNSFQVEFSTGYDFLGNFIDDAYPAQVIQGLRVVSVNVGMVNNTTSALANLKAKARSGTPINGSFVLGSTAGFIVTSNFNGLQLNSSNLTEQGSYVNCSFGASEGTVTPGAANEFTIAFT